MHTDHARIPWTSVYTPHFCETGTIEYSSDIPPEAQNQDLEPCGLDFVALRYRIIIRGAEDTMWLFNPGEPHGTTAAVGVENVGFAITVSAQVVGAFAKMEKELADDVDAIASIDVSGPGSLI